MQILCRKPVFVEEENCGWDITSVVEGQTDRCIEVKGRGGVGGVALTPNEWIKAQRLTSDYWLCVVVNRKTKPELDVIQDPASKLSPKDAVRVVRYAVGSDEWWRGATKRQGGGSVITRQHRQELLCRADVHAIAAQAGLLCSRPDPDYGIDLSLRNVAVLGRRHRDTSVQLDLQLRSTTRASVTETEVKLDLDVETYNDLRTPETFCPRVLVLLVMPAEEAEWMNQSPDQLAIRHCAYWRSLHGHAQTSARSTIRIGIPLTSLFSVEAVRAIMQRIQERKMP